MTLPLSKVLGPLIMCRWASTTGGNTTANLFLMEGNSNGAPNATESAAQKSIGVRCEIWRFVGGYMAAGTQSSTMTMRINGVSQGSTATTVGAAAGTVITDLASPILTLQTDLLSILFKFAVADAGSMAPRSCLLGAIAASF